MSRRLLNLADPRKAAFVPALSSRDSARNQRRVEVGLVVIPNETRSERHPYCAVISRKPRMRLSNSGRVVGGFEKLDPLMKSATAPSNEANGRCLP